MDHFHYRGGHYFAEDVSLEQIAGDVGTPCYVYSRATMEHHWKVFDAAFGDHPHTILYAVKANGNLAVLNLLSRLGSGFDIVSGGELERVLQAGGRASEVVFSGVGKSEAEITRALEVGVRCLNLESAAELERVNRLAGDLGVTAPVALRINPDVDPGTHPYIATGLRENKFGIPPEEARSLYRLARDCQHVEVTGVARGKPLRHGCPSHGIGMTPDERQIWVSDGFNSTVHMYDATVMPPKLTDSVKLRGQPGWVTFSIDGTVGWPSTGQAIDTKSHKIIAE